jgi:hypothetical protein
MKYSFKNYEKVEYTINWSKPPKGCYGICDCPKTENPKIIIDPKLTKQKTINILIHEVLHAFFWQESETKVTKCANTLSRLIHQTMKQKFNE